MMKKQKNITYVVVSLALLSIAPFRNALADETHMWPVLTDVQADSKGEYATVTWTTIPVTLTEAELDSVGCNMHTLVTDCNMSIFNRVDKDKFGINRDGTNKTNIAVINAPPGASSRFTWRMIFSVNTFTPGTKTIRSPNYTLNSSCYRIALIGRESLNGGWPTDYPWATIDRFTYVPPGIAPVNSAECIGTPPDNEWCAPETQSLNFDFGEITASDIQTVRRSRDIVIKCTSDMKFKLNLQQQNETPNSISLSNGMKALFKVEGADLTESIHQGIDGLITLPLTASLTGDADSTGPFEGSGVIGISYP